MLAQTVLQLSFIVALGLTLGSFATALVWRVPQDRSWIRDKKTEAGKKTESLWARSSCPHCHQQLKRRDLVPLLSWLFTKGQCRYCGHKIGWQYPVTELLTLICCLCVYMSWGWSVSSFILIAAIPFLVALFVIDMEHYILPDQLVLILGLLALPYWAAQIFVGQFTAGPALNFIISYTASGLLYAFVFWFAGWLLKTILKKEALGWGDIKFSFVAGLWLGIGFLPYFLIFSGALGIVWGLIWRFITGNAVFPFGPAIIMALLIGLLAPFIELF